MPVPLIACPAPPGAVRSFVPEPHAEVAAEGVERLDDARLDHHLAHRDVDLADEPADLFQPRRRVLDEERVGARIDHRAAALGEDALLLVGQDLGEGLGALVVQLERLGADRLELGDLRLRFERELLARGELVARRDPHHVAGLAHVEALALQDDVERLVPRHVLQAQREVAGHRVARDDVQAGEVGDHLQHRAHFDVLEVERELLADVSRGAPAGSDLR